MLQDTLNDDLSSESAAEDPLPVDADDDYSSADDSVSNWGRKAKNYYNADTEHAFEDPEAAAEEEAAARAIQKKQHARLTAKDFLGSDDESGITLPTLDANRSKTTTLNLRLSKEKQIELKKDFGEVVRKGRTDLRGLKLLMNLSFAMWMLENSGKEQEQSPGDDSSEEEDDNHDRVANHPVWNIIEQAKADFETAEAVYLKARSLRKSRSNSSTIGRKRQPQHSESDFDDRFDNATKFDPEGAPFARTVAKRARDEDSEDDFPDAELESDSFVNDLEHTDEMSDMEGLDDLEPIDDEDNKQEDQSDASDGPRERSAIAKAVRSVSRTEARRQSKSNAPSGSKTSAMKKSQMANSATAHAGDASISEDSAENSMANAEKKKAKRRRIVVPATLQTVRIESRPLDDEERPGKRSINRSIWKNMSSLHRERPTKPEHRNARIKHKKRFDKAMKKRKTAMPTYKTPTKGAYDGERVIHQKVVRSVKF